MVRKMNCQKKNESVDEIRNKLITKS